METDERLRVDICPGLETPRQIGRHRGSALQARSSDKYHRYLLGAELSTVIEECRVVGEVLGDDYSILPHSHSIHVEVGRSTEADLGYRYGVMACGSQEWRCSGRQHFVEDESHAIKRSRRRTVSSMIEAADSSSAIRSSTACGWAL